MAYYLTEERFPDVVGAYRRYQAYLQEHQKQFPPGAFALGTAEWWQNPNDHHSPHDAWLESVTFSEPATGEHHDDRITALKVRLLGAYHDGFIELFYPRVFGYSLSSPICKRGLGDWLYDEFRLSPAGHVIHEIEWNGFPDKEAAGWTRSRWIIEASDIEYQWISK